MPNRPNSASVGRVKAVRGPLGGWHVAACCPVCHSLGYQTAWNGGGAVGIDASGERPIGNWRAESKG